MSTLSTEELKKALVCLVENPDAIIAVTGIALNNIATYGKQHGYQGNKEMLGKLLEIAVFTLGTPSQATKVAGEATNSPEQQETWRRVLTLYRDAQAHGLTFEECIKEALEMLE